MVTPLLTTPPPGAAQYNPSTPTAPDDASGRAHRQLIGYIGFFLPWLLYFIAALRPFNPTTRWQLQDSVSAYYYTGAVAVFVGLLVALALFLLTYRGFDNEHQKADRRVAVIAGLAAIGVAFFPTHAPLKEVELPWWTEIVGTLHYTSAVILFAMFAVFCLWLFRLTKPGSQPSPDKQLRNNIYLLCGVAIIAGMVWAGVNGAQDKPIFWPESLALVAFAFSWLVKGEAHKTIAETARSMRGK